MLRVLLFAGLATLAAAQPPAGETQPDIVVRGQQEQGLRNFVTSLAEAGH